MLKKIIITLLIFSVSFACSAESKSFKVLINNPSSIERSNEIVSISLNKILEKYSDFDVKSFDVYSDGQKIPYQLEKINGEEFITVLLTLKPNAKSEIEFEYGKGIVPARFKNETYAELSPKKGGIYFEGKFRGTEFENVTSYKVPSIHKDHDALFKYEGPGWESEIVGYRLYLDWRNATDIFGKKMRKLVLKEVGVQDTVAKDDSYHNMQEWGMDIFKVGSSLGIGSFGMWSSNKVNMVSVTDSVKYNLLKNGPLKSEFTIDYYGWMVDNKKYDLNANISINARCRLTKCVLTIDNAENLVTGLAKYDGTNFIKSSQSEGWQYIALYGKQSLADDDLGIAVLYNAKDLIKQTEDKLSHVLVLRPSNSKVEYYFTAAWIQEPNGIKNQNEFVNYLDNLLIKLNNPIVVEL
jgi:hypothetical protein